MKAENSAKIQFDSLSANEAFARGAAAAFLARYDPTVPQLADIKTAVSEAVTNCIVHAYPDAIGPVTLSIAVYPERLVKITVTDKDCYSYRRESGKTGRMALFGMLQER